MIGDLHKHIEKLINEQNNSEFPEFEGYSPVEMESIIYEPFGDNSPIKFQKLTDSDYQSIPILAQSKYLAELIAKVGELKLTNKGFLPTKIVADIYSKGYLKDYHIELGISKLYKETDSITIHLTRMLIEISGLAKKRNNKLSLTKAGEKTLEDNFKLFQLIFKTFSSKFNWAYFDGYGENNIGQLGYGFSLMLLSKYGKEKRLDTFYSDKYFKAFPHLIDYSINSGSENIDMGSSNCYSLRTFDRYLDYFGLIKIEKKRDSWNADKYISKTEIFQKLIKFTPPGSLLSK